MYVIENILAGYKVNYRTDADWVVKVIDVFPGDAENKKI
jgi:hypothetical protein